MSVEIYIDDLKPDIQRQVLEELGLETAEDGNYDIIPLFSCLLYTSDAADE